MNWIVLLGRIFFSSIFLIGVKNQLSSNAINYAAAAGVPVPHVLVPMAALLCLIGGLSVLLGYKARWGAWLLVLFLVPVTLMMHKFWGLSDSAQAAMQKIAFMKNMALMGAALIVAYFGSGPLSVDECVQRHCERKRAGSGNAKTEPGQAMPTSKTKETK